MKKSRRHLVWDSLAQRIVAKCTHKCDARLIASLLEGSLSGDSDPPRYQVIRS